MATIPISQSEDKLMNTLTAKQHEDVHSEGTDEILNDLKSNEIVEKKSKLIPKNGDSENENEDNEKEITNKELYEALKNKDSDSDNHENFEIEIEQNQPNFFDKLVQKYGKREVIKRFCKLSLYFGFFIAGIYSIKKIPKIFEKEIKLIQHMK